MQDSFKNYRKCKKLEIYLTGCYKIFNNKRLYFKLMFQLLKKKSKYAYKKKLSRVAWKTTLNQSHDRTKRAPCFGYVYLY